MRKLLITAFIMICPILVNVTGAIAEDVYTLIVFQPQYNFEFAVYRTDDMPANWYKTYDEYYVTHSIGGNWVYGNADDKGIMLTDILVGSVNPANVKWLKAAPKPYVYITPGVISTPDSIPR